MANIPRVRNDEEVSDKDCTSLMPRQMLDAAISEMKVQRAAATSASPGLPARIRPSSVPPPIGANGAPVLPRPPEDFSERVTALNVLGVAFTGMPTTPESQASAASNVPAFRLPMSMPPIAAGDVGRSTRPSQRPIVYRGVIALTVVVGILAMVVVGTGVTLTVQQGHGHVPSLLRLIQP